LLNTTAQSVYVGVGTGIEKGFLPQLDRAVLTHCVKPKHTNDQPSIFSAFPIKQKTAVLLPEDQEAQLCITAI